MKGKRVSKPILPTERKQNLQHHNQHCSVFSNGEACSLSALLT